jgi:hypothetical protein
MQRNDEEMNGNEKKLELMKNDDRKWMEMRG